MTRTCFRCGRTGERAFLPFPGGLWECSNARSCDVRRLDRIPIERPDEARYTQVQLNELYRKAHDSWVEAQRHTD